MWTATLAVGAFIWGSAFAAQKSGMNHIGPWTFLFVRFLIGGAALLPVIWLMSRFRLNETPAAPKNVSVFKAGFWCGVVLFAGAAAQQVGLAYTTAGKAGFITALYVILVPICGIFIGKNAGLRLCLCAVAAIAGMYMLCVNEELTFNKGDLFMLACAFSFTAHILLIDHYSPLVDAVKLSSIQFFLCGLLAGLPAYFIEIKDAGTMADLINAAAGVKEAWFPLFYTGVMSSSVAYTIQVFAQKHIPPVIASLVMSLESVFAALTGWLILGETLTAREFTGCAVIFAAIIAAQLPERNN
ncbi:transporter [Synergistales bacterium]|nr:transporter [Synergistales bacterium]